MALHKRGVSDPTPTSGRAPTPEASEQAQTSDGVNHACVICTRVPAQWAVCNGDIAKEDRICGSCVEDPQVREILSDPMGRCPLCELNRLLPAPKKRKTSVTKVAHVSVKTKLVAKTFRKRTQDAKAEREKLAKKGLPVVRVRAVPGPGGLDDTARSGSADGGVGSRGGTPGHSRLPSLQDADLDSEIDEFVDTVGSHGPSKAASRHGLLGSAAEPVGELDHLKPPPNKNPDLTRAASRERLGMTKGDHANAKAAGSSLGRSKSNVASFKMMSASFKSLPKDFDVEALDDDEQQSLWQPKDKNRLVALVTKVNKPPPPGVMVVPKRRRKILKKTLGTIIGDVYEKKLIADAVDDREEFSEREPMPSFVIECVSNQFGLRSLAEEQIMAILDAIRQYHNESKRIHLFGKLCGVIDQDEYIFAATDALLDVLRFFFNPKEVQERMDEMGGYFLLPLGSAMRCANKIVKESSHFAMDYLIRPCEVKSVPPPWPREARAKLAEPLRSFLVTPSPEATLFYGENCELIDGDSFLSHIMDCWFSERKRLVASLNKALHVEVERKHADAAAKIATWEAARRQRLGRARDLTDKERANLVAGVFRYGNKWEVILKNFAWAVPRSAPELERWWRMVAVTAVHAEDEAMDWTQWEWDPDWEWGGLELDPDDAAQIPDDVAMHEDWAGLDSREDTPAGMIGGSGEVHGPVVARGARTLVTMTGSRRKIKVEPADAGNSDGHTSDASDASGASGSAPASASVSRTASAVNSRATSHAGTPRVSDTDSGGESGGHKRIGSSHSQRRPGSRGAPAKRPSRKESSRNTHERSRSEGTDAARRRLRTAPGTVLGRLGSKRNLLQRSGSRGGSRRNVHFGGNKRRKRKGDKPDEADDGSTDSDLESFYSDDDLAALASTKTTTVQRVQFAQRKRRAKLRFFDRMRDAGTVGKAGTLGYTVVDAASGAGGKHDASEGGSGIVALPPRAMTAGPTSREEYRKLQASIVAEWATAAGFQWDADANMDALDTDRETNRGEMGTADSGLGNRGAPEDLRIPRFNAGSAMRSATLLQVAVDGFSPHMPANPPSNVRLDSALGYRLSTAASITGGQRLTPGGPRRNIRRDEESPGITMLDSREARARRVLDARGYQAGDRAATALAAHFKKRVSDLNPMPAPTPVQVRTRAQTAAPPASAASAPSPVVAPLPPSLDVSSGEAADRTSAAALDTPDPDVMFGQTPATSTADGVRGFRVFRDGDSGGAAHSAALERAEDAFNSEMAGVADVEDRTANYGRLISATLSPRAWGSPSVKPEDRKSPLHDELITTAKRATRVSPVGRPKLKRQRSKGGKRGKSRSKSPSRKPDRTAPSDDEADDIRTRAPFERREASGIAPSGLYLPVRTLALARNDIRATGAAAIAEAMKGTSMVRHLDLSENRIGARGAAALVEWVADPACALRSINLFGNRLGNRPTCSVLTGLASLTSLSSLNLGRNDLTSGPHVAQLAFSVGDTLTELDLSWNIFRGSDGTAMCKGLAHAKALRAVNLEFCSLSDAAGVELAASLKGHKRLEEVGLRFNQLRDKSANALCDAVAKHPTLRYLDLSGNFLGPVGVDVLSKMAESREAELVVRAGGDGEATSDDAKGNRGGGAAAAGTPGATGVGDDGFVAEVPGFKVTAMPGTSPPVKGDTAPDDALSRASTPDLERRASVELGAGSSSVPIVPSLWDPSAVTLPRLTIELVDCNTPATATGIATLHTFREQSTTHRDMLRRIANTKYKGNVPVLEPKKKPKKPNPFADRAEEDAALDSMIREIAADHGLAGREGGGKGGAKPALSREEYSKRFHAEQKRKEKEFEAARADD